MTEPKRLFDCIQYQLDHHPLPDMLAAKENGEWRKYSTAEIRETVNELSAGLVNMGVSNGDMTAETRDKIAIISRNRPEWLMLDLAVQQIGAILVPVYPTINVAELEFILKDAQVKMIFVNDEELFHKVLSIKAAVPCLQEIFTFEHVAGARHWKEVLALADAAGMARVASVAATILGEDLATIIYTSGTTGTPKGVMLSHRNIVSNAFASLPCFPPGNNFRTLSFLPLNHILEKTLSYIYFFRGASIYYAESLDTIAANLREVQPNMFTTVPRLLEKVYDRIMAKGAELTGVKKRLFFWAHELATRFEINKNQGWWYNTQLAVANKLIFSKWREALGNRIDCIVTGGAACQVRLIKIFTAARIVIMEGYGLTETSPVVAVNRFDEKNRMFGTVGPVIDGVEVKIAEDGEILCKGSNIMMGYYKRPDLTAEAVTDGWFHTGDIGTLVDNKFLKITDRKKEMFKTSGGKYVAPLPIETKLKESPFIEQAMVVGSERKFVGALIVPAFPYLEDWAKRNGIQFKSDTELLHHPQVLKMYNDVVEEFNKNFSHVEQVKKFELIPHEWSIETGEMTPKLSIRRKVVMDKYKNEIENIYV